MASTRYFRALRILIAVPFVGVAAIGGLLGLLWLDHFRETDLLTPTGPYAVGRTQYVWTGATHAGSATQLASEERKLVAWIWYPAVTTSNQDFDDYLPAPWRIALTNKSGFVVAYLLTRDLSRVRTHSVRDAELSPRQKSYPVILMRGGHSALTTDYTSLAEDLASHGYVVVGIDAPYRTFVVVMPGGRVISRSPENNAELGSDADRVRIATRLVQAWSTDMSFAIDQMGRLNSANASDRFYERLDLQHIGAFGHSLGGAESLQFCHDDDRCKAGIDVDGAPFGSVVAEGVSQPFMFLMSDHSDEPAAESGPIEANLRSIFDRLPRGRRLQITIRRATHFGFADDVRNHLLMAVLRMRGKRLAGRRQLVIASDCINAFFDVYLRGEPVSRLELQRRNPATKVVR